LQKLVLNASTFLFVVKVKLLDVFQLPLINAAALARRFYYVSSRHDTDSMHGVQPNSAERESESEGKGGKVCGSNLMYYTKYVVRW
jgi:hypothetical protein